MAAGKAVDFIRRHRDGRAPYFLEVAVYGPHSQLDAAVPGPAAVPLGLRRPSAGRTVPTGGNCGPKACGDLTLDDLVGYGDPRADNAPTYLNADGTTARRRLAHQRQDPAHRRAGADALPRPRADGAVDRPDDRADPRGGRARTPTWC